MNSNLLISLLVELGAWNLELFPIFAYTALVDNRASAVTPAPLDCQSPGPALVIDRASHFKWLCTGFEAFSAMLAAINAATKSVRLETYIYVDDELGQSVRAA